ncbi:MAG: F0F1 ATP synthase subunit delta [Cellvibrionaceae bacterium]|nr:F0F1 ATP synthase subunit delta [Cellvibrionaceae bacterium]
MAELVTLARPYAKAVFEFARSNKTLDAWQQALEQAAAVSDDERVATFLLSPQFTRDHKGKQFAELFGDELDPGVANFFSLLAENGRLTLLPQIAELFGLYKANEERTIDVNVSSAFAISKALQSKLAHTLKEKLNRDISLTTEIDKSLIGGAVVRAGDTVIDASVRGRLDKLAAALTA